MYFFKDLKLSMEELWMLMQFDQASRWKRWFPYNMRKIFHKNEIIKDVGGGVMSSKQIVDACFLALLPDEGNEMQQKCKLLDL